MLPVKKILCPTDFSEPARRTLDTAAELARHFGAELQVLHVVPFSPPFPSDMVVVAVDIHQSDQQRTEEALGKVNDLIRERVPAQVPSRGAVEMGLAPNEICCFAKAEGVDLIVISTHGHTGWRHMVFGSVAEAVVRGAPCPVLTLHAQPALRQETPAFEAAKTAPAVAAPST